MYGTLLVGDVIMVNKLAYGARLGFPSDNPIRFPGYSEVSRNDIVCFNYPNEHQHGISDRTVMVKRVIGVPRDVVELVDGAVVVNDDTLEEIPLQAFEYHVRMDIKKPDSLFNSLGIVTGSKISNHNDWLISATSTAAAELEKDERVLYMERWRKELAPDKIFIFPFSSEFPWSPDNFGPIWVPGEGDTIELTPKNLELYNSVIRDHEGHITQEDDDGNITIDGDVKTSYIVEQDYYFVLGDNRHDSSDSRFWGFIPADHIIGKVGPIMFSYHNAGDGFGSVRWNRFFNLPN